MKTRDRSPRKVPRGLARMATLALVALASQAGCGREFFREWANQDASEAVFEKSRDPRWRLDLFSVDPPALARYADPYDPDRPPAPPDDYASEATSPVPQWPDNRLMVPAEGTGYIDMLEAWSRNRPAGEVKREPGGGVDTSGAPRPSDAPPPPGSGATSPFSPAPPGAGATAPTSSSAVPPAAGTAPAAGPAAGAPANSGTPVPPMSPIPVPEAVPGAPASSPPTPGGAAPAERPQARNSGKGRDPRVMLSAFQEAGLPLPAQPPGGPPDSNTPTTAPPAGPLSTPPIGMDPNPINRDLSQPDRPRPDLSPDQYRSSEAVASELAGILVPGAVDFDEAEAAGLPRDSNPYVLTMEQVFTLALINSRAYQTNLENVYLNALAVTLQRFAFTPQFYAGMSPTTGVLGAGFPPPSLANQFLYQTAETGQQLSTLNLGAVAGFGKAFQTAGRVLAGFASQVIFNFTGQNPGQPTVRSFLPLTLVQPLLRGGGRAVALESLTQAERNLLYSVRSFAKFRQEFVTALLAGGNPVTNLGAAVQTPGFSGGGNTDPTVGYLNVLEDIQLVENNRRNIASFEQIVKVYSELIKGESSGLTKLQLDQVDQNLQNARTQLVTSRTNYRSDLDNFKIQMGLPPDTPMILDRRVTMRFKEVYNAVDDWQRNPRRNLEDLPKFAEQLPKLEDLVVDGRSVLGVYNTKNIGSDNEAALEDLLLACERTALEHRLDMMNNRAALYDAWRAIKVQANALQGVLNVTLTNQFLTPPTTNNPFAFVEQAKSFSLVLNAELPLVRVAERNSFRSALIGYQRARRALQSQEDTVKVTIRNDVRNMQTSYLQYEIAKRNLVLLIRQKDQAFEQIIAPPQGTSASSQGAVQTNNLTQAQSSLLNTENQLITLWYNFQTQRLALYRDLGILPYDEWEAFHELFPDEPLSPGANSAARGAGATRAAAERTGTAEEATRR